jgi:hypothetical protein
MGHPGFDLDDSMHAGMLRIVNDARNSWGMAQAFATQKNILKRIEWQDNPKSYAQRVIESRTLQVQIMKDVEKYGYRRDV